MARLFKLIGLIFLSFTTRQYVSAKSADYDFIVQIEQGVLRGIQVLSVRDQQFLAFLGIPYAKPPVGDLRFKAPQYPESWIGTYDATIEGNSCPQHDMISGEFAGNENCLFLNVFTNKLPQNSEQLQPVMVWIHGGCYKGGSGTSVVYGPDHIITQDVILVTINYRLGLLGFLSLSEVGVPGNNGLKDQVMALRWVQKNIAKFGGDPNRVTIFGESAGGASVHYHLLSPMSKGLFHGAISQSGSVLDPWAYAEPEFMRSKAFTVGERMECNTSNSHELFNCFQKASPDEIVHMTIGQIFSTSNTVVPVRPTREDGTATDEDVFLPARPEDLISSGKFHQVPFITGVNSREAIIYMEDIKSIPNFWDDVNKHVTNVIADLLQIEDPNQANEISDMALSYYVGEEPLQNKQLTESHIDLFSDLAFVIGTDRTVKMQAELSASPVYSYFFAFDGLLGIAKLAFHTEMKGVSHADELGYLFQTAISLPVNVTSDEMKTLLRMVKMWTNFAKTGDPTSEKDSLLTIKWAQATKTNHVHLNIDKELSMQRDLRKDRMQFWEDMLGPGDRINHVHALLISLISQHPGDEVSEYNIFMWDESAVWTAFHKILLSVLAIFHRTFIVFNAFITALSLDSYSKRLASVSRDTKTAGKEHIF